MCERVYQGTLVVCVCTDSSLDEVSLEIEEKVTLIFI